MIAGEALRGAPGAFGARCSPCVLGALSVLAVLSLADVYRGGGEAGGV